MLFCGIRNLFVNVYVRAHMHRYAFRTLASFVNVPKNVIELYTMREHLKWFLLFEKLINSIQKVSGEGVAHKIKPFTNVAVWVQNAFRSSSSLLKTISR